MLSCAAVANGCASDPSGRAASADPAAPSATASGPVESTDPPNPAGSLDCGSAVAHAETVARPGALLLVGEVHGTAQAPDAVGRIVCDAASRSGEVLLGLEIPGDNQPAVDAFLSSNGDDTALSRLRDAPHFSAETKDGRNSEAMLQLLGSIRAWRRAGASIDVVCFDAAEGTTDSATERDAVMAETIIAAKNAHPDALMVTLSGNIHNRTVDGVPWDETFVPMGAIVRAAFPEDTISLDFRSGGGTMWVCMGEPMRCGTAKTQGRDRGGEPFVELHDERDELGFDGVLYVGPLTASPPAVAVEESDS